MKSIQRQLIRRLLLIFGALLGCGCVGVYLTVRAALLEEFDRTLRTEANAISAATEQHITRFEVEFSEDFFHEFHEGIPINFFEVRQTDGVVVRRSKSLADRDIPVRLGSLHKPQYWNLTLPSGAAGRAVGYVFTAAKPEGAAPSQLSIMVASDSSELRQTLFMLAAALIGCGACLLVATALLVPRVLRNGLAPINALADWTERIDANQLSIRFASDGVPQELAPIVSRINGLLARLERSFERERQFSNDLAHELRTPVSELRTLAELALHWPETRTQETDHDILNIAVQMEGIVTRLLQLLRSEREGLSIAQQPVRVSEVLDAVWTPFIPLAEKKALQVERNIPADTIIESDPVLLRSILANLLDNAVAYSPVGGSIRVEGGSEGEGFAIRVANSAPGVDLADTQKFFDRFWRKDSARADPKQSGLGLSLARSFAQALGGVLNASLDGAGMVVLTFSSPAAPAVDSNPNS